MDYIHYPNWERERVVKSIKQQHLQVTESQFTIIFDKTQRVRTHVDPSEYRLHQTSPLLISYACHMRVFN